MNRQFVNKKSNDQFPPPERLPKFKRPFHTNKVYEIEELHFKVKGWKKGKLTLKQIPKPQDMK